MASSVFSDFDRYDGANADRDRGGLSAIGLEQTSGKIHGERPAKPRRGDTGGTGTSKYNYNFTPKFQHSVKNNPMCGICFPQWISILTRRRNQIEWTVYWPRIFFISFMSVLNSAMGLLDHLIYGRKVEAAVIHPRPVFILGHPRTGTTLVHSLLALDSEQFCYCSTFCAGFPSCFLWFESIGKVLFRGVIDDMRPMDNVRLDFDLPQEDELATNVMSAGISPYMPLFFMKQEPEFRPFYAFDDASETDAASSSSDERLEDSAMAEVRKAWIDSFLYLLRKLTVRDELQRPLKKSNNNDATNKRGSDSSAHRSGGRRLILKSPVHTARIALLNQLFPEAQYIYIHRNPYDVFRSAAHMADTTYWYTYMNTPSNDQITEFILRQYEILYDRYEQGRTQLLLGEASPAAPSHGGEATGLSPKPQRLVEISYDELSQRPIETAQRIYRELGWDLTPGYRQRLEEELAGHEFKSYKRNSHKVLDPSLKEIINERWGPSFERFGYIKE
ncbi:unnamed protein product [Pseudo-nitzschia multistriata]|uniref:Sulfotransferase domain-containing protein n=1 Tax=Pseudo-nitzschia multistriata TaxID=183589 RepID=A0A448YYQ4_9STRA|nr:unnamed protein product [Pseudo-nitzschia multistriata]